MKLKCQYQASRTAHSCKTNRTNTHSQSTPSKLHDFQEKSLAITSNISMSFYDYLALALQHAKTTYRKKQLQQTLWYLHCLLITTTNLQESIVEVLVEVLALLVANGFSITPCFRVGLAFPSPFRPTSFLSCDLLLKSTYHRFSTALNGDQRWCEHLRSPKMFRRDFAPANAWNPTRNPSSFKHPFSAANLLDDEMPRSGLAMHNSILDGTPACCIWELSFFLQRMHYGQLHVYDT